MMKCCLRKTLVAYAALASIAIVATPTPAWAQAKVGIVNVPRLLKESKAATVASKRLESEFSKRDADIQKLADTLRNLQEQIERNSATMSDSERRNKEREVADQNRELQRKQREFREDLERRQSEETAKIIDSAQLVINRIAESEKYDLILRDAVFANDKVDITSRVLRQMGE